MVPEKNNTAVKHTYNTLEEILQRKDQLSEEIERDKEKIGSMWNQLFVKPENATKGEYVATLVTNSITAIDAFLLARKLMKQYKNVFSFFGKSRKKKK